MVSQPDPLQRPPLRRVQGRSRKRRSRPWGLVALLLGGGLIWLSRGWWWPAPPPAQMILVLGGDVAREREAAALAARQGLPVVVSGGSNP